MFKKVTGTRDILAEETPIWQNIEETARGIFSRYNYSEIRTPIIEEARLFNRSLGDTSDIVQKQMFLIEREDQSFVLRPEGTAAIARAYVENNLEKTAGFTKLYYIGPMFRAERPQKGRLRQFHHIGCEAIGSGESILDAETISLADTLLKSFSVTGYKIKINSIGCADDKQALIQQLHLKLEERLKDLCADCQKRFINNPLRILDCKQAECRQIIDNMGINCAHLCPECAKHYESVRNYLDLLKIEYAITPNLVRGLDYYTRTVFEISHADLGAQDALGAGGRYDNLLKELGGTDTPAMGFALGVERIMLAAKSQAQKVTGKNLVYLINLGDPAKREGFKLIQKLRQAELSCDTDYESKSLKGAMRKASDLDAKYVIIIGDEELKKNVVMIKDMATGKQEEIDREKVITRLKG